VADFCAAFQDAVIEIVTDRLRVGLRVFRERFGKPTALVIAGGVAANQQIRHAISRTAYGLGTPLVAPPVALCTDNGAIIAWAGAERLARGLTDTLEASPRARWPLQEVAAMAAPAPEAAAPPPEPREPPPEPREPPPSDEPDVKEPPPAPHQPPDAPEPPPDVREPPGEPTEPPRESQALPASEEAGSPAEPPPHQPSETS
jgi:outer membrane biosynthesis protein TonB